MVVSNGLTINDILIVHSVNGCIEEATGLLARSKTFTEILLKGRTMETKGFFSSLFDVSFTEFLTTRVIKIIFVLAIVFAAISAFGVLISFFSRGVFAGLLGLVLAPIVFIVYVLLARIWLEVVIVLFRIAENTNRLVELNETAATPPSSENM